MRPDPEMIPVLIDAAADGMSRFVQRGDLRRPAAMRLAFRELGLAIGAFGIALVQQEARRGSGSLAMRKHERAHLETLAPSIALGAAIQAFWLEERNRPSRASDDHRDIDDVMLATSLVPEGFVLARRSPLPK